MLRALTTGEISAHFAEIYGAPVSKETISRITAEHRRRLWQRTPAPRSLPIIRHAPNG
jgi:transposase-like protein